MLKPIPDFPDYFADKNGDIWTLRSHHRNAQRPNKPRKLRKHFHLNRWFVSVFKDGKTMNRTVAPLMLSAFVSPRPKGMWALHGEKGSFVDTIDNLYWGTPQRNQLDRRRDCTDNFGERNPLAKLNELQIRIIKRAYALGGKELLSKYMQTDNPHKKVISCPYLARTFGVNKTTVQNIINGRTWKQI